MIANFQSPQSLFINIYNVLPAHIQPRFAADKAAVISKQQSTLTDESTASEIAKAEIYTTDDMQKFFMKHFRPTITRGNIFRHLLSIRMRYNENPREVLDRVVAAVGYAKKTVELLNETAGGVPVQKILKADITHILTHIFCTMNNNVRENNQGGINKLVQKVIRTKELQYNHAQKFNDY